MKTKLMFALFVLTLAFTGSVLADDPAAGTVGYYMKTRTAPEWKNWIAGVGVGFWVANRALINEKRDPLFCFSGDYEPDPKAVLDAWIEKDRAKRGTITPGEYFADGLRVDVALLIAYEASFPCALKGR